jgi:hypothetical protein
VSAATKVRQARPTCALCGVPVAEFYETHDPFLQRVVMVAACHGATQRVVLDECDLAEMGHVDLGLAFMPDGPPGLPPVAPPPASAPPLPAPTEYARTRAEACCEEYEYPRPGFGMSRPGGLPPLISQCGKRKGHTGPHRGAEKC